MDCQAGRSRSVYIVAAYLTRYQRMTVHSALSLIQIKQKISLSESVIEMFYLSEFNYKKLKSLKF